MSEVNIDAALVNKNETRLDKVEEKLVEMSNGCICCTLREDLLIQIKEIASANKYDYLLIESSGISEPLPVAVTFEFTDELGKSLKDVASLDTMVTVIDAANFFNHCQSPDDLKKLGMQATEEDERTLVDLIIDQVEFANVIILNKVDLVTEDDLGQIRGIIKTLSPDAKVIETKFSKVDLKEILNTKLFDFEKAQESPGWMKELNGEHIPETEEYGISSFVYRARKPFHPEKFSNCLNQEWAGVIRSKGFFWLASRPEWAGLWSQAGGSCRTEPAGYWLAAIPKEEWPEEMTIDVDRVWDEKVGDCRQEIVLIGIEMNKEQLTKMLDSCLLTDEEMKLSPEVWKTYYDPFPKWTQDELEELNSNQVSA
jgi:G3E family GTPase